VASGLVVPARSERLWCVITNRTAAPVTVYLGEIETDSGLYLVGNGSSLTIDALTPWWGQILATGTNITLSFTDVYRRL